MHSFSLHSTKTNLGCNCQFIWKSGTALSSQGCVDLLWNHPFLIVKPSPYAATKMAILWKINSWQWTSWKTIILLVRQWCSLIRGHQVFMHGLLTDVVFIVFTNVWYPDLKAFFLCVIAFSWYIINNKLLNDKIIYLTVSLKRYVTCHYDMCLC